MANSQFVFSSLMELSSTNRKVKFNLEFYEYIIRDNKIRVHWKSYLFEIRKLLCSLFCVPAVE